MPYVTVPKDLTKVKSKILFNLTKRQLICFSLGLLIGVSLYFAAKEPLGNSSAAMLMILTMLPAFLFALYEKNGQHLEVIIRNMIQVLVLRPKKRPYKTNNFYTVIARKNQLDKVARITNIVLQLQRIGNDLFIFRAEFPEVGAAGTLRGAGVCHIEHIFQLRSVPGVVNESDAFRTPANITPHSFVPQFIIRAGGGFRALGVYHKLFVIGVLV